MTKIFESFRDFSFEKNDQIIMESLEDSSLEFATSHGLIKTMGFKPFTGYKDGSNHEPVFSLFHYESGWPRAGLRPSFFTDTPLNVFKDIIKSASTYLKTGKASMPIIKLIAFLYTDANPGGRSQGPIEEAIKRIEPEFNEENKDNPSMVKILTRLIGVLKTWTGKLAASRLNLAVSVYKVSSYTGYMGSDFEKVYRMCIDGIKKNRIKIQPDSKIVINKDDTNVSTDTIDNSIGFTSIDISNWSSTVTMTVDGKEYIVGSFDNKSAYGRY